MASEPSIEQAVSRSLRENLQRLQRTADELHQAVADLVAACASSRPTNALPPMLRAQTAAAALAAALDVLSRFVTAALQPAQRTPAEQEAVRLVSLPVPEPPPAEPAKPPPKLPVPMGEAAVEAAAKRTLAGQSLSGVTSALTEESGPPVPEEVVPEVVAQAAELAARPPAIELPFAPAVSFHDGAATQQAELSVFSLADLSAEMQELHHRASRVAKVSMQDIKMLRPEEVRLGREHKDLCVRLRNEMDKARKEYDRRFRQILDHPVDYFYSWMVEILADGDPEALGEYPYSSPVPRR